MNGYQKMIRNAQNRAHPQAHVSDIISAAEYCLKNNLPDVAMDYMQTALTIIRSTK